MHRHAYKGRKLSRKSGPRKALIRSLATSVILYEKIETTLEKAKEAQPVVEKLITRAKSGTLHDRRMAAKILSSADRSLEKLFAELGPLYKDRNGGYTRIIKTGYRKGDNAKTAILELLDTDKLTKKVMTEKKASRKSNSDSKEKVIAKNENKDTKVKNQKTVTKKPAKKSEKESK